jgi:hypothetical protein
VLYVIINQFEIRPGADWSKLAAPWFAQNIRPHLSGPSRRLVGEVVGGALASCQNAEAAGAHVSATSDLETSGTMVSHRYELVSISAGICSLFRSKKAAPFGETGGMVELEDGA